MDLELVSPSAKYREDFFTAADELPRENHQQLIYSERTLAEVKNDFGSYLRELRERENSATPPMVTDSVLWAVSGDKFIGRISFRHRLNEFLKNVGGHIGFAVRPSARRNGMGTAMLEKVLQTPRAQNIGRLLITCDEHNVGSRKIIEKNGGVYSGSYFDAEDSVTVLQFWIDVEKVCNGCQKGCDAF